MSQRSSVFTLLVSALMLLSLSGCVSAPPSNTDNICNIFEQKRGWYKDASKAARKWDTDVAIILAFMRKESSFVANARPPRRKILWIFPGPRASDAYGYAQARNSTWDWYKREAGGLFASRDDFADAADFIGWYNKQSAKRCGISTRDPRNLYLAYHEGQGGYNRGSYKKKKHVLQYADVVTKRTWRYQAQLKQCEGKLKKQGWYLFR